MASQGAEDFNREILSERYEVQRELGKKAGRRTLLARDLQTQELVVVKLLSFSNDFEWNDLKLFEREAETLKALSFPTIPRYLDYFELDSPNSKGFALIQSYIPAQSLEEQLKAGRSFSEVEVKQLAKAILEILKYLHERQPPVIHRDIKPSNILLTNRSGNSLGEVYLVDFGSVQTVAKRSSTMTIVGTYGYMPPEQFSGKATPASDLYSLGATLIYLVTGQHPADLPQTDLRIEFEQAAHISRSFSGWLRRITKPIASQRFASADEAMQGLVERENEAQNQRRVNDFSPRKPPGSEVILTKNTNSIEIIIPPVGFFAQIVYTKLSFVILLILCMLSFLFTLTAINFWICIYFEVWLFIGVVYYLWEGLLGSFGQMRIFINQREISLNYKLFSIERHSPLPNPRRNIIRLERTKNIQNNSYLIIWAGRQKYELNNNMNFPLTNPEVDWLAEELSHWLDLPITRE